MILVTGALGFIGSCLIAALNEQYKDRKIIAVDDFGQKRKYNNLESKNIYKRIEREDLFEFLNVNKEKIDFIYHLGARTDTTEFDEEIFLKLNINYSKKLWEYACTADIPYVYASSAATYGDGSHGYEDRHDIVDKLVPLNPYGDSKLIFDKWVLAQQRTPPLWAGLKFFNVYGPNENHKSRMASVIFHTFHKVSELGYMNLFKSHRPDFGDGEQSRDFVYVKDVVSMCLHFIQKDNVLSSLYNIGTGQARSFRDLAEATFAAMGRPSDIRFIDTPIDIRDKYQYFTEANMAKLKASGYDKAFYSLEDGVADYVKNYLAPKKYW